MKLPHNGLSTLHKSLRYLSTHWRSILASATAGVWLFGGLLFFGSMVWAVSKDPFKRDWFTLRTPNHGKVEGVAVLPKPVRPVPVVFFVYGAGGSMITSGNYLRQFAELGVASVVLEYDPGTSQETFNEQFMALRNYVARQPWAKMDRTAWIGFSRGAQQTGAFLLEYPETAPQLYVRVGGGRLSEEPIQGSGFNVQKSTSGSDGLSRVLLVHGERDSVFPQDMAVSVKDAFEQIGVPVDLIMLEGQGRAFGPDRHVVMRSIGEYTKAFLTPEQPLPELPVTKDFRFLLCIAPAFLWGGFWIYLRRNRVKAASSRLNRQPRQARDFATAQDAASTLNPSSSGPPVSDKRQDAAPPKLLEKGRATVWEKALRCTAVILAIAATAQTMLHVGTPRLGVGENTLAIGRGWLIPEKWREDFDTVAYEPYWRGKHRLRTLLTHVELSNYCVYELVNWEMEKEIYNRYVLSPIISPADKSPGAELNWRRPLWEFFYPRIRRENFSASAARTIGRNLRERVTIAEGDFSTEVETIWRQQIANPAGFERIYVAALRSAGVPARLDETAQAEFWTGTAWQAAPRPLVEVSWAPETL